MPRVWSFRETGEVRQARKAEIIAKDGFPEKAITDIPHSRWANILSSRLKSTTRTRWRGLGYSMRSGKGWILTMPIYRNATSRHGTQSKRRWRGNETDKI